MDVGDMTFTVTIDDKRQYKLDLGHMLEIHEPKLNEHFKTHSSQYAWVATLAALTAAKVRTLKNDLDHEEAQFGQQLREAAASSGEKITEKAIADQVLLSKRFLQLRRDLIRAEEQVGVCVAAQTAFSQRKDCLLALASNLRAQGAGELTLGAPDKKPKK